MNLRKGQVLWTGGMFELSPFWAKLRERNKIRKIAEIYLSEYTSCLYYKEHGIAKEGYVCISWALELEQNNQLQSY